MADSAGAKFRGSLALNLFDKKDLTTSIIRPLLFPLVWNCKERSKHNTTADEHFIFIGNSSFIDVRKGI